MEQLKDDVTLTNFDIEDYCRRLGENEDSCLKFGQKSGEKNTKINSIKKYIHRILRENLSLKSTYIENFDEIENEQNCNKIDSHGIWGK